MGPQKIKDFISHNKHLEILSKQQQELLPYIKNFRRSFYLVGGTAIALHIGHRESIDFDLFTCSKLNKSKIREKLWSMPFKQELIFEDVDQFHFNINGVKLTFFRYPYTIEHKEKLNDIITFPSLLQLAAMKAFALGRRAKWKDYIDLYFIIRDFYLLPQIVVEANKIFEKQFSEKLFRQQLAFHDDIDYSEQVQFSPKFEVDPLTVKEFLLEASLKL